MSLASTMAPGSDPNAKLQYMKDNPATSFMLANKISEETGADVRAAAVSKAFETRRNAVKKEQGAVFERSFGRMAAPVTPLGEKPRPGEVQEIYGPQQDARTEILNEFSRLYNQASEDQQTDESIIKNRIMREMNPTEDIDKRVKALTRQGLVTKALLSEELAKGGMDPASRRALVASRLNVYADTVDNLLEIRKNRLKKVDDQIAEEVGTMRRREKAMSTRMSLLGDMTAQLEKIGAGREEMAMMDLTLTKARDEIARLRRKMGNNGITPETEANFGALAELLRSGEGSNQISLEEALDVLKAEDRPRFVSFLKKNAPPVQGPIAPNGNAPKASPFSGIMVRKPPEL